MRVENHQMSLAAYVRWTYRAERAAYVEHYLPLGAEQTPVHETSITGMPSNGSINNFRGMESSDGLTPASRNGNIKL